MPDFENPPSQPRGTRRRGIRPPQRVREGRSLLGLRVSSIVAVETVAAAVLLIPDVSHVWAIVAITVAVLLAIAVIVTMRGVRIGTWVISVLGFLARSHIVQTEPNSGQNPLVSPELAAIFPGIALHEFTSRDGERLALAQWQGCWTIIMALHPDADDVLSTAEPHRIPLAGMLTALNRQHLSIEAMQLATQTLGSPTRTLDDSAHDGATAAIAAELTASAPYVRHSSAFVSIRINPSTAAASIRERGGGMTGVHRVAAAAIGTIRAEAAAAGLVVTGLDGEATARAMTSMLLQPPASGPVVLRWIEGWKSIASAQMQHRCFVVDGWAGTSSRASAGITAMASTDVLGLAISHEFVPRADGHSYTCSSTMRISALTTSDLAAAATQLRRNAKAAGIGLRLARGAQSASLRATMAGGRR